MRFVLRETPERQRQQRDGRVGRGGGSKQALHLQPAKLGIDKGRAVDLAKKPEIDQHHNCLLYTSDAADE